MKRIYGLAIVLLLFAVACTEGAAAGTQGPSKPANAVEISIIYAP
jgi:hypothetical protein